MEQNWLKLRKNEFYKKVMTFVFILSCTVFGLKAQSRSDLEIRLLQSFKSLSSYKKDSQSDSLFEKRNDKARDLLLGYLTSYSISKSLLIQLKKEGVEIVKSKDNKLSIVSWSTWENGVKQYYSSATQYRNNNNSLL